MDRSSFGFWGLELAPEEFAKALAALGVLQRAGWLPHRRHGVEAVNARLRRALEGEKPFVKWKLYRNTLEWVIRHREDGLPAATLAKVWDEVKSYWPRLELSVADAEAFWVVEELSRPEVGARSVYVRVDEPAAEIGWNWPLNIGFLTDPVSQSLRRDIEKMSEEHPWMSTLTRLVNLEGGHDACDLLLIPLGLRAALASVLAADLPVRADCVIILEKLTGPPQQSFQQLRTLRAEPGIAGAAQAYVPPGCRPDWLRELIRYLSHNVTLDVALRETTQFYIGERAPVLVASRRLVEFAYVSQHLLRLADRFQRVDMSEKTITLTRATARSLNMEERDYPLAEVAHHIRHNSDSFLLNSEQETASAALELERLAEETTAPEPPGTERSPQVPEPRWIQAEVFDNSRRSGNYSVRDAMRPGTPYLVRVHIGPKTESSVPTELPPVDETSLPRSSASHELTVVFAAPDVLPEPQVATILLPRTGPSNTCDFRILIGEDFQRQSLEARITILHANRVLQTAILAAPVGRAGKETERERIRLLPEVVVRVNLSELGGRYRQPFDGVLVLNHNTAGLPGVTKIAGKHAGYVGLEGEHESAKFFNDKLSAIVDRPEKYGKLTTKASTDLLRQFARHGFALHRAIFGFNPAALDAVATGKRIQVISAKLGGQLPVEFLYDRPSPADESKVCKGSERALADGKCPHTCPPPGQGQKQVICPLGFWGLSRVIERHLHDQQHRLKDADYALQAEPVRSRRRLNVFTSALFAASKKVDAEVEGGSQRVSRALSGLTNKHSARVESWKDWASEINKNSPPLLVLLPHTVEGGSGEPGLEISKSETLDFNDLDPTYVRGAGPVPPIVVLMGCGTDAPTIPFLKFPLFFRLYGAAIVIGTGATIIGEHAAPVTEELLKELAAVAEQREPVSFGEVMLNLRRKMLARGYPMAMCLTAYGDTDWIISNAGKEAQRDVQTGHAARRSRRLPVAGVRR